MKRKIIISNILVLVCCVFVACSSDDNNSEAVNDIYLNIPDTSFETKLISLGFDTDGEINQRMLKKDAVVVSSLNLYSQNINDEISDLTGIEGFINLTKLYAGGNALTSIDLSFNSKLDTLSLVGNYISSIDISNNPDLIWLDLKVNDISSITGLSQATHLKWLSLSFNLLEEFNLDNESLEYLLISDNLLESFDVSGAQNLKGILLKTNGIKSLDLSSNTLLETLVLSDNKIVNINLEHNSNLTHLYISSNLLTNLDVSNNQELYDLRVDRNPDLTCIKILSGQDIPTVSKSDYQELSSSCN